MLPHKPRGGGSIQESESGKVLIVDPNTAEGWKIDKITADNIKDNTITGDKLVDDFVFEEDGARSFTISDANRSEPSIAFADLHPNINSKLYLNANLESKKNYWARLMLPIIANEGENTLATKEQIQNGDIVAKSAVSAATASYASTANATSIGGQTLSEIFEDDGVTAKKAKAAQTAQYASEDTSKGTIEERLTNLGFKEGVATYTGEAMNSKVVNSLKKCGKFVIFNFQVFVTAASNLTVTIPQDFRPKTAVDIWCGGTANLSSAQKITIGTNGVFSGINNQGAFILNAGWETN